jgi:prepilin-type processing-associated H-X9-DG protein
MTIKKDFHTVNIHANSRRNMLYSMGMNFLTKSASAGLTGPADADLVRKFIPMLYNMFLLELAWILTVWKGKYKEHVIQHGYELPYQVCICGSNRNQLFLDGHSIRTHQERAGSC